MWGNSRNEGLRRLHNSVLEDKGVLQMDFSPNKTPIEIIKGCEIMVRWNCLNIKPQDPQK